MKIARRTIPPARRRTPIAVLLCSVAVALVTPASAQDNEIQTLLDQIRLIQADLVDLQRDVYGEQAPARAPGGVAAQAPAPVDNRQLLRAAQVEVRLAGLEGEIRVLTGTAEQIQHLADQNRQRMDRLIEDVDFRLIRLEDQLVALTQALQGAGVVIGTPLPAPGAAPAAAAAVQAPLEIREGDAPGAAGARVLGVLPADRPDERGLPVPGPPPTILPAGTPEEQYAFAYGLLQQFRIVEAEQAFAEFLVGNEGHELFGMAQYWLGETFYVRDMFQKAALRFVEGYQKAPTGPKAADSLLKLGMSLARMDQTQDACATLGELAKQFPDPGAAVAQQAAAERQRIACP